MIRASTAVQGVRRMNLEALATGGLARDAAANTGQGWRLSLGALPAGPLTARKTGAVVLEDPASGLFHRLAAMKVLTSRIAMHLEDSWRAGLFRSLDHLLDQENWDLSEKLPSEASFRTFLRMIIFIGQSMGVSQVRRPALGATATGTIVAMWSNGPDRLTIECQPDDHVRFVLSKRFGQEKVTNAGTAPVTFLPKALAAYEPKGWWRADDLHP